jgi:hypothetical protein
VIKRRIAAILGVLLASTAPAAQIVYTGTHVDLSGTGFGNVTNLLSLQAGAGGTTESGSVSWNGSADVLGGNAANTSKTQSATALVAAGIDAATGMGLVFNINEPGNASDVTLHDFTVRFTDGAGATLFDATYTAPDGGLSLADLGGTGQSGHLFQLWLNPAELNQFFGAGTNRAGMFVDPAHAIGGVAGGAENFFLAPYRPNLPPGGPGPGGEPVPEPASLAVWGALAVAGLAWRRRHGASQAGLAGA